MGNDLSHSHASINLHNPVRVDTGTYLLRIPFIRLSRAMTPVISTNVTTIKRGVSGFLPRMLSIAPLKKLAVVAGVGCSGYLCAKALRVDFNYPLENQLEDLSLELNRVKLEQQYLQDMMQEFNTSHYTKIANLKRKLKAQNDTLALHVEASDNKIINITHSLDNVNSQLTHINGFKLIKLQNIFRQELEQVCQSVRAVETELPMMFNRSEEKLLRHMSRQRTAIKRIMKVK